MGLKIGELSKKTGVPISTIRYYVSNDLLPAPIKVGKQLSHYDEDCIHKLQTISYLQENRHFPLSIIANILRRMDEGLSLQEAESVEDVIFGASLNNTATQLVDREEFLAQTGLTSAELQAAEKMGMMMPYMQDEGKVFYNHEDILWGRDVVKKILPFKSCWNDFAAYMKLGEKMLDREFLIRKKVVKGKDMKQNMQLSIELSKAADFARGYLMKRLFQKKIRSNIRKSLKEK